MKWMSTPVDLGDELRQGIQPRLHLAPVVVVRPVAHELLHRRELHALRLIGNGLTIRPARRRETAAQIEQILLGHADVERANRPTHASLRGMQRQQARYACGDRGHRGLAQQLTAVWIENVGPCLRGHVRSP